MKHLKTYNESLRDKMVGKSEDEVLRKLKKLSPNKMLINSIFYNFIEGVEIAIDRGAYLDWDQHMALRLAATNGYTDIVKLLLDNNVDIHAYNDIALRFAAQNGNYDTVKFLIEKGANVHAQNDEALFYALENGYIDIANLLKQHGSNLNEYPDGK